MYIALNLKTKRRKNIQINERLIRHEREDIINKMTMSGHTNLWIVAHKSRILYRGCLNVNFRDVREHVIDISMVC